MHGTTVHGVAQFCTLDADRRLDFYLPIRQPLLMSLTLDQLADEAQLLPASSRALLAERIVESLDLTDTDEIQRIWSAEVVRRRDEVRSGRVQPIPGDVVLAEVRGIVGR